MQYVCLNQLKARISVNTRACLDPQIKITARLLLLNLYQVQNKSKEAQTTVIIILGHIHPLSTIK